MSPIGYIAYMIGGVLAALLIGRIIQKVEIRREKSIVEGDVRNAKETGSASQDADYELQHARR
jgi:hypothetical protein